MNADRFDAVIRAIAAVSPRRGVLHGLASAAIGVVALRLAVNAEAKKKRRNKKKPPVNEFDCLNVGQKCCGKDKLCCSGICGGKKPKRGKKDKRKCVAHDTGSCQAGEREEACGGDMNVTCLTSGGLLGVCDTTTGNAGFCTVSGDCFPCRKDTDCQDLCGPGAACIRCVETCFGVGGTACFGPSPCEGF